MVRGAQWRREWVEGKRQEMAEDPFTYKSGAEVAQQVSDRQIVRWFALDDEYRTSYLYLPTPPASTFLGAIALPYLLQFAMLMQELEPDVPVQIDIHPFCDDFTDISINDLSLMIYPMYERLASPAHARFYDNAVRAFLVLLGPDADEAP